MTAVLSTAQDAFFDVLKTVPLLLLVYALLYYIENRLTDTPALLSHCFPPAISPRQRSSQYSSRPRTRPCP